MLRGLELTVNGQPCEVKLKYPRWTELHVGSEVLSLVGLGLRLDGEVLTLVVADDDNGRGAEGGERTFSVQFEHWNIALELALALKTLRGNADTGAGISMFVDPPADELQRPPPAE
mmetsp:Transcript_32947/g.71878  ORF Transcript_32947/g.71878 Transcript_32947/m.71878 type:complete len:116 (+) Transcript_32947:147-494(+)